MTVRQSFTEQALSDTVINVVRYIAKSPMRSAVVRRELALKTGLHEHRASSYVTAMTPQIQAAAEDPVGGGAIGKMFDDEGELIKAGARLSWTPDG